MNFKKSLAMSLSTMMITGCSCVTKIGSLNYSKLERPIKITEKNEIIDYFKKEKYEKAGRSLEKIIEKDMSRIFGLDMDLMDISYGNTGYNLIITKKGSLDIIHTEIFLFDLNVKEKEKMIFQAEIYGPKIFNINFSPNNEDLEKKEKMYSACFMKRGGYAFPVWGIKIDPRDNSLYSLVQTIAHEWTHTLIYKQSSVKYLKNFAFAYLNWINNNEIINIHETACDIIADKVSRYFKENHLIKETKLYNNYERLEKFNKEYYNEMSWIIKEYESIPQESRINEGAKLFKKFEEKIKERYGLKNFKINETKLALSKRYSGSKIINDKLNFLYNKLGAWEFVKTIPKLYSTTDLETVCIQLK